MINTISKIPKEYLKQGLGGCGAYSVKAILSAYDKDDERSPYDYCPNLLLKYTRAPTASIKWVKVLQSYGINAQSGNAKHLSDKERIDLLKNLIDKNTPVMLRVGNGYLPNGKYSNLIASFIGHWITIWGYDNREQVFYIYDSCVSLNKHNKTIPVGNTKRTSEEVLRDWGKGFPWLWQYNFIAVECQISSRITIL